MKIRPSCTSVRTWIAGLAGALSLVGVAMPTTARDNAPPPAPAPADLHSLPRFLEPAIPEDALQAPAGWSVGRALRGSPPPTPGGGCQASGPFKIPSAAAFTNGWGIVLTTSASTTARLDNFKVDGAGTQSLTDVSWSGWFRSGAASPNFITHTYAAPGTAALPSSFIITVFDSVNGEPVQLGAPQTVTFGANSATPPVTAGTFNVSPDTTDAVPSGNTTGTTTFTPQNFIAKLPQAISLTGGNCYWIEIRPTPVGAATVPTNLAYFWRTSSLGDGVMVGRPPNAVAPGNLPTSRGNQIGDASFCLNVPTVSLADGLGCTIGSQMACDNNPNYVGHAWDGSGAGNATSIVDVFTAVDNFSTSCPMTINNVCWYGAYVVQGAFVVPATDSFRIRVYRHVGGPTLGAPDPTPIAERLVSTSGSGADGQVVRSANTINLFQIFGGTSFSHAFSANLSANPIVIPSGGCYYIEIADSTGVNFYVWLGKNNFRTATIADGFKYQTTAPAPYARDSQLDSGDFVWGFNMAAAPTLIRSTDCLPVTPNVNTACTTATALTIDAATPTISQNILSVPTTTTLPPGCGINAPNRNGAWFTVVGNGQNLTISTCLTGTDPRAPQTNFDTAVGVYCSLAANQAACNTVTTSAANPNAFVCIASNDDAATVANCTIDGASVVSFPSVSGQLYYIYVWGAPGAGGGTEKGYFYIKATTTAGSVTAPTCGSVANCRITVPTGPGSQAELETCGGATNNTCDVAEMLPLNTWATGTANGLNGARDADYWHLPAASSNPTDAGQWFTIEFRAEFPPDFTWFDSPCVNGANATGVISSGISQCTDGSSFNIFIPAGEFFIRVRSASTGSPACDPLSRGNRYAFRVSVAPVGACCVTGTVCAVTVARDGQGLASDPQDCSQRSGVYLGNGTTCSGPDNLPCDVGGGVVAGTTTGSCCNSYGICYTSSDAALTCTDGVFTAAGTCTAPTAAGNPFTCTAAPASAAQRCCLTNGVCIVIPPSECTTQGGTSSAGDICIPNPCPQPTIGACCDITGACFLSFSADCPVGSGVTYNASATSCTPNPCPAAQACCTTLGTCILRVAAACTAAGNTPVTGTACPPTPACAQPTQVCCAANGACTLIPIGSSICVGTITAGSVCPPTPACPQPTTVCCQPNGTCAVIPIGDTSCTGQVVNGTACNPTNPCPQPTTVCCDSTGTCTVIPIGDTSCTGQVVNAAACAPTNPCTQPTTCCFTDGTCVVILVGGSPCTGTPGTGSSCEPTNPCPQPTVCCRGTTCTVELPAACTASGGGVVGFGTVCNTVPDSCMRPCCTPSGCTTLSIADCTTAGGVACGDLGTVCSGTANYSFQACCVCNTSICTLEPVANCTAGNRLPQGPGTVCGAGPANPCSRPTACCASNGTCSVVVPEACVGTVSNGSFTCPPATACAQPTTCCAPDGTCTVILVGGNCTGGTPGAGSVCGPAALCPQPTTCCLPNGSCSVVLVGGICNGTVGGGSTCPPATPCPQPTACCAADGSCTLVNVGTACNGTARPDTVCPPSPACPTASVNCCRGTTCISTASCTGGSAVGSADLVVGSCGTGNTTATCCFADFNHDGIQSIDDLFLYFNAYFTSSPFANVGGDAIATPTIDDLFLYINAYFGVCL